MIKMRRRKALLSWIVSCNKTLDMCSVLIKKHFAISDKLNAELDEIQKKHPKTCFLIRNYDRKFIASIRHLHLSGYYIETKQRLVKEVGEYLEQYAQIEKEENEQKTA